jgi:hypothetical protein
MISKYFQNSSPGRDASIRVKLGAHAAIGPFPDKPKGMHWRTYQRLQIKAIDAESHCWPNWALMLAGLTR